jgi:hypothetical protein
MPRKEKLNVRPDEVSVALFGISTNLKDFKLCYLLNKHLEWKFFKIEDLPVTIAGSGLPEKFSLYMYRDDERFNTYYLLANRIQDICLLPSFRQADFFLIVEGPSKKSSKESLVKSLGKIPNIQMAFETEPANIKGIEILLNDLELHLMNRLRERKDHNEP